jgi:hypothetical protein
MPARRVVIHAGLPKTGTTALQETLAADRERLAGHGVVYWGVGREHNTALAQIFDPEGGFGERLHRRADRIGLSGVSAREHLRAELAAASDVFVISAENLSAYDVERLTGLRALVSEGGAVCEAVAYVREPRSALTSRVQQKLKSGHTIAELTEPPPRYEPHRRLEQLLEVFGPGLSVRGYPGRGLIADFYGLLGLSAEIAATAPAITTNESFSHEAALWLDAVNTVAGRGQGPAGANRLGQLLTAALPGPRFQLPPELLESHVNSNPEGVAWISGLLGQDVLTLHSTVAPPPDVPAPDPRMAELLHTLMVLARERRQSARSPAALADEDSADRGGRRRGRRRRAAA